MSKIAAAFQKHPKAFVPFITSGDPDLETTKKLILALDKAGATVVELGIPFSDPVAEGEVIQQANLRALKKGCTTDKIFDMIKEVRKETQVPLVFLTYINPIFTYGTDKFYAKCAEVGVDGTIIPDIPFEEKGEVLDSCKKYGVDLISLIAPTSADRIQMIAKEAMGYIYLVSSLGVTGVRTTITTDLGAIVQEIRKVSKKPVAVGFGIATPEQAKQMATISDGAIVGSAIVKIIGQYGRESVQPVTDYVTKMVKAVESVK
jgi:tryptophan synthase alpha chain